MNRGTRSLWSAFALIAVLLALVALPAVASATPTDDVYGGTLGQVESNTQAKSDKSGLPFTGLDVGIVVLAGGFLVGTGLVIRRASRGS
ncbi:MAG: hypothetical protein E6G00_00335 [Actinobacteria bacterium]|nr:MAG: hypothetical protein E6G00_00335 [Actinomycetota bacterium]